MNDEGHQHTLKDLLMSTAPELFDNGKSYTDEAKVLLHTILLNLVMLHNYTLSTSNSLLKIKNNHKATVP